MKYKVFTVLQKKDLIALRIHENVLFLNTVSGWIWIYIGLIQIVGCKPFILKHVHVFSSWSGGILAVLFILET